MVFKFCSSCSCEKNIYNYKPSYSIVLLSVGKVSLGMWMWQCKISKQPIKIPISVSTEDGAEEKAIKRLVQHMLCPDPSDRSSMEIIYITVDGKYKFTGIYDNLLDY